jgi:tRNA-Thr(GGU) m(6)t(6)A37 methyltransferase TsaA
MTDPLITLWPVGYVQTAVSDEEIRFRRRDVVANVVVNPGLTEALEGIEGYSHLFIIFWMHRVEPATPVTLKVHPRGRTDLPPVGLFATRTPHRPNPIGLAVVELLGRRQNVLTVRGLDAFNGTPVLDIKPYDFYDRVESVRVPDWWLRMTGHV